MPNQRAAGKDNDQQLEGSIMTFPEDLEALIVRNCEPARVIA
jgi:hypothetical protein